MAPSKKKWPIPDLPYGLVLITRGRFRGRIGDYDDDADDPFRAVIYFGGMLAARGSYLVDKRHLKEPNVSELYKRYTDIQTDVMRTLKAPERPDSEDYEHLVTIMAEAHQIYTELEWRNLSGRFGRAKKGNRIFLAHSSKDKGIVRMVHDDLAHLGHDPWLDEREISVGDSIISKLESGISDCRFMMVFLSKNSENSKWMRIEWETKFWSEIEKQEINVLPALLEDCEIPPMLARRRFADFRESYNAGLEAILESMGHHQKRTALGLLKVPKQSA